MNISGHAIERYQERVANLPADTVRAILSSPTIRLAAKFGAPYVRLPTGQRVVIDQGSIVTVLPVGHHPGAMDPNKPKGSTHADKTNTRRHSPRGEQTSRQASQERGDGYQRQRTARHHPRGEGE